MTTSTGVISEARFAGMLGNTRVPVEHRALWATLWDGGLRLVDVLLLDVRDVDLGAGTASAENAADDGCAATVVLSGRTVELLRPVVGRRVEGPLFVNAAGEALSRAAVHRWARSVGCADVQAFRAGGQVVREQRAG